MPSIPYAPAITTLRAYRPDDLDTVVTLWYRTWHETFPDLRHPQNYAGWHSTFQTHLLPQATIWLAECEGAIVGFMALIAAESKVDQLFVDRRYHRRGIGSVLLNQAKQLCPQGLRLYTLRSNAKACAFYEHHGFRRGQLSVNAFNQQPNVEYRWQP